MSARVMIVGRQAGLWPEGLPESETGVDYILVESMNAVREHLAECDVVFQYGAPPDALSANWELTERLRWVHVGGVGIDWALFPEFIESGVILTNSRGVFDVSLPEYLLALMLASVKHLPETFGAQQRHQWQHRLLEPLTGRRALIVGAGSIARASGRLLRAMGMDVVLVGRRERDGDTGEGRIRAIDDLPALLPDTDWLIVLTPLTPETRGLIGTPEISALPAGARFANIGRGPTVDEAALIEALRSGHLAGAVLDVFEREPLPSDSPLWDMSNVIVSPHIGGDELDTPRRLRGRLPHQPPPIPCPRAARERGRQASRIRATRTLDQGIGVDCPGMSLVALEGLTMRYPGGVTALDGLTLEIEPGVVGLVGANGAGKSTLIKILLGLLDATSGSARVFDLDVRRQSRQIRQLVGYMPEHDCLPPDISASDFVNHMARMSGLPRASARERSAEVLRHVGLFEERYRPMGGYSTGMKQRVKLAQALVHDPRLMLLDEPTNGLDPAGRDDMLDLIERTGNEFGIAIVMASHLLGEIERVCEFLVAIDAGHLLQAAALGTFTQNTGTLVLEVEEQSEALAERLTALGLTVLIDPAHVLVEISGDETYDQVRDAIVELDVALLRMEPRRSHLEDLFRDEQRPDDEAAA